MTLPQTLTHRSAQVLLAIALFNLISTWLHYTDNALFLSRYPGLLGLQPLVSLRRWQS